MLKSQKRKNKPPAARGKALGAWRFALCALPPQKLLIKGCFNHYQYIYATMHH
jgi:hypothetical protein